MLESRLELRPVRGSYLVDIFAVDVREIQGKKKKPGFSMTFPRKSIILWGTYYEVSRFLWLGHHFKWMGSFTEHCEFGLWLEFSR